MAESTLYRRILSLSILNVCTNTFRIDIQLLHERLGWPTLFCNSLEVVSDRIVSHRMRIHNGKKAAIEALHTLNYRTFAAGDSYNDLAMIEAADGGCLFRAPASILADHPHLALTEEYGALMAQIKEFLLP